MGLRDWLGRVLGRDSRTDEHEAASPAPSTRPAGAGPSKGEPRPVVRAASHDPLAPLRGMPVEQSIPRAMALLEEATDATAASALLGWLVSTARDPAIPLGLRLTASDFFGTRGEYADAAQILEPAVRSSDGDTVPVLARMADLARQRGAIDEAARYYEEILAIDIAHPGVRERLMRMRAPAKAGGAGATLLSPEAAKLAGGRLELIRELGRGGAGAVFLGRDRTVGRDVAIKLYHASKRGDRNARLRGEAQVACALACRNVVRVFDLLEDLGALTLEYCPGGSLKSASRAAGVSVEQKRAWSRGVADALAIAHDAGWVHRDLKPGNVLVRADRTPVLTDFGLARRVGSELEPAEGTPGYVAPEARANARADSRIDVYAFGALLREVVGADDPVLGPLASTCLDERSERRPANGAALCVWLDRAGVEAER